MLMIDTKPEERQRKKKRFFFDRRWLKKEGVQDVIRNAWDQVFEGSRMFRIKCKIRNCRIELLKWKNNSNCNAKKKIDQLKSQLEKLQYNTHMESRREIVDLKNQLKVAYKEEELFWHQKARINWIKEGDKNTKFFHAHVKGRRRRNRMLNLQREDGSWTENEQELGKEVADFYRQLFTSKGNGSTEEILRGIPPTITASMNDQLTRGVDEEEIRSALFSMSPDTAPGMDANRLKGVLNFCISKTQSAFIPGRQILDNVIIAHEYLHFLKNKRYGKEGYMAVKLDMSKAYDRVEWKFLRDIMQKMGFSSRWIRWIMKCVESVCYSFNINGEVKEFVVPERGIRQGDPLSPYLFLLCSEGFSNLLDSAEENKQFTGLKISRNGPRLTHLFFADDSLIFCKADTKHAEELRRILEAYERSSGQVINLEKSSVFFSKNMEHSKKIEVCCRLGNIQMVNQGKYLGLPMVITRTKDQIFGFIRDNMNKHLGSWKQKLLSQAGKEVLLKAVTQAMPTYAMSCFKLPLKLCKELSAMMARYWWGDNDGKDKMHLCSWKRITQAKNQGGLGFKDLVNFNRALLGKQIWRMLVNPNLLASKVLKAKYYPTGSIFKSKCPQNASWIWQSLRGATQQVEDGTWKKIGNGLSTDIWEDKWIVGNKEGRPSTTKPPECKVQKVQDLITHRRWNRVVVLRTFNGRDAEKILSIPISLAGKEDSNFWIHSPTGQYTVNTGYKVLMKEKEIRERNGYDGAGTSRHSSSKQMWTCLWKLNIKHKLKTFMWKCINNALPVNEVIFSRTQKGDPICKVCGEGVETVDHALLNCRQAKQVWQIAPVQWEGAREKQGCFKDWWNEIAGARSRQAGDEHLGLTVNILWQIWKSRNEWEFNNNQRHALKTIQTAQEEWIEFCEVYKDKEQLSTVETAANQFQGVEVEDAEVVQVKIAALRNPNSNEVGIGVTAMSKGNVVVAAWAMHERSYNCPQLDEAEAIKLAMSKLVVKGWRKVIIQSCNKQLIQQICSGRASNIKLNTLVDDILSLKALFRMCSFCAISKVDNHISIKVGDYALGIIHDEEWFNPLCC
ncbi:uncharacterized protein LOC113750373 [Coffea eugenioides]|uniref:uncharacterized protein LOC113750373 n=1 Tax=Coffea eugenioides TaxID=49369 RepID=UPI000F60F510|nr:uncharacterized protein LOC113750373 [Coffea eugenioides]